MHVGDFTFFRSNFSEVDSFSPGLRFASRQNPLRASVSESPAGLVLGVIGSLRTLLM